MFPVSLALVVLVVFVPHLYISGGNGICAEPCQPELPAFSCSKGLHEGSLLRQLPELPYLLEGWRDNVSMILNFFCFSGACLCVFPQVSCLPPLPRAVTARDLQEGDCIRPMRKIP